MPPSLLPCFSGNLDKLLLHSFAYAINVHHGPYVTGRGAGMTRLNSGHFGRRASEPVGHDVDRDPCRFPVPAQLDPEAAAANGGTAMLIHDHQSPCRSFNDSSCRPPRPTITDG